MNKSKKIIQELNDTIKTSHIRFAVISEGMEREVGLLDVANEIITENFPNIGRIRESPIKEGQRTPNIFDLKRPLSRYIIVKFPSGEHKEKILKQAYKKDQ